MDQIDPPISTTWKENERKMLTPCTLKTRKWSPHRKFFLKLAGPSEAFSDDFRVSHFDLGDSPIAVCFSPA